MQLFKRSRRVVGVAITTGVLALGLTGVAGADLEVGSLPGGTEITVSIDNPIDGSTHLPGDIAVDGTASVGAGVPVANTRLIYVLDVSGSTASDCNDTLSVLECEVAGAQALNQAANALPPPGTIADVGVVAFATDADTGDVGPGMGQQDLTGPATDAGGTAGVADVEEVLGSAFSTAGGPNGLNLFTPFVVGALTNFEAAVLQANALAAAGTPPANVLVVFLSDGQATAGGDAVAAADAAPANTTYQTFAVGQNASCSDTGNGRGSLDEIAAATGGVCTPVLDPADLVDVLPGVIDSNLTNLDIQVDGGAFSPIGNANIAPDLPQVGAASVLYGNGLSVNLMTSGLHTICVRATGNDIGGEGSVTDCHEILINTPPDCSGLTADPDLLWPPNHRFRTITISGAVDPDGDEITQTITGVTQDEPVNGLGDGNTSPDAVILSDDQVQVRSERSGLGDGRVYHISVTVEDEFGATCEGTVFVGVPHDQGQGATPIDSAPPFFNSIP